MTSSCRNLRAESSAAVGPAATPYPLGQEARRSGPLRRTRTRCSAALSAGQPAGGPTEGAGDCEPAALGSALLPHARPRRRSCPHLCVRKMLFARHFPLTVQPATRAERTCRAPPRQLAGPARAAGHRCPASQAGAASTAAALAPKRRSFSGQTILEPAPALSCTRIHGVSV